MSDTALLRFMIDRICSRCIYTCSISRQKPKKNIIPVLVYYWNMAAPQMRMFAAKYANAPSLCVVEHRDIPVILPPPPTVFSGWRRHGHRRACCTWLCTVYSVPWYHSTAMSCNRCVLTGSTTAQVPKFIYISTFHINLRVGYRTASLILEIVCGR